MGILKLEYLLSLTFGALGAWIVTCFGNTLSLLDHPNERSSHYIPTPKGGGIGILISFVFVCIFHNINFTFWFPLSIASTVGFYGDRIELSPKTRLSIQFLAAFVLILGMDHSKFNIILLVLFSLPFAVFVVGTANFYNFMDGINGIAGITGIVGFGLIAFYSFSFGYSASLSILAVCISLACMGFLPFNVPKAKVFMGDGGSILLGFVFSGMVVYLSKNVLDFICLMSFLFPFYADELLTMLVRLKNKENLTTAHRRHLYQLLANECKISHWKISAGYGLFQLMIGISILLVKNMGLIMVVSALVFYGCFFTICSFIFRKKTTHFA